jgi:hypothetical protein
MTDQAKFKERCPVCRKTFTASSPFALAEAMQEHMEAHFPDASPINWNDPEGDT